MEVCRAVPWLVVLWNAHLSRMWSLCDYVQRLNSAEPGPRGAWKDSMAWARSFTLARDGQQHIDLDARMCADEETSAESSGAQLDPGAGLKAEEPITSRSKRRRYAIDSIDDCTRNPADGILAQTRRVSEEEQVLSAESALSLYTDEEHAGIVLSVPTWDWNDPVPVQPAEALAQGCLRMKYVTFAQMSRLFDMLSPKVHGRHISQAIDTLETPRSFTIGASIFSGMAAVHTRTRTAVWTARLLTGLIQSLSPSSLFSTVFLHRNVPSGLHVDAHNHTGIFNTLVPLSRWKGGELWCSSPQGAIQLHPGGPKGELRQILMPCCRFNARLPHATMPWTGDRFILGAFHIREDWRLKEADADFLASLGFCLQSRDLATQDPYQEEIPA